MELKHRSCFFLLLWLTELKVEKKGKRSPTAVEGHLRLSASYILRSPNCQTALSKSQKHETNSVILSPLRYTLGMPACPPWWPELSLNPSLSAGTYEQHLLMLIVAYRRQMSPSPQQAVKSLCVLTLTSRGSVTAIIKIIEQFSWLAKATIYEVKYVCVRFFF